MKVKFTLGLAILLVIAGISAVSYAAGPQPELQPLGCEKEEAVSPLADDPSPPAETVKLIFVHHSCGENWLGDEDGGLGTALKNNNYFVSDTNYEWGPPDADLGYENIGDHTDIGHWYNWFVGPNHITYTTALYTEFDSHSYYTRTIDPNPSLQNEVVMFKSCYPNSYLDGNPGDPPTIGANPLRGQDAGSGFHTVANAKGIYNDLLTYFATRQDKLFVAITAPPQMESETDAAHAANARAFNDWLVNDWLDGYSYDNVAVFDFYNVLTSNGGAARTDDPNTNDEGWADGNHHRWLAVQSRVQHTQTVANNYSAYWGGNGGGSHPTAAGNQKATAEFVPLLNVFYNRWSSGTPVAPSLTIVSPNGGEHWLVSTTKQIEWTTTGSVSQVNLYYSTDNFVTHHDVALAIANTGNHAWTTPITPSTSMRVRVESVVSPATVYDVSDAVFTLYEPGTLDEFIYLPVVLRSYTSEPVSCPHPLTGVTITGPTTGDISGQVMNKPLAVPREDSAVWQADALAGNRPDAHPQVRRSAPLAAQPTDLAALHRSGQTFLTWTENTGVSDESYHVYRHTAPIDAGNIDQATRLTEKWGPLSEGSSIFYTEIHRGLGGDPYSGLHNYVITDLGEPLTDTVGLFVWTTKETGDFYYAVTTVDGGAENRADFGAGNSLASPVAEAVADPEPVLVWEASGGNGRVYTQFMDYATFNPTFELPFDDPNSDLQYAYNYWVGLPTPAMCGGSLPASLPLYLHIEGHGSRYEAHDNSPYWCALEIWGDDPRQSWYFGFSASYDYRTGDPWTDPAATGPIVNYTEARLLRSIYDTLRDSDYAAYNLDGNRIYVYGHSMGGSGALALAMRYPNVFAASYSSEPMTNYSTSGDGGGTDWRTECETKWGSVSANLPISNVGHYAGHLAAYNGTGVWTWQNHQANLVSRSSDDMAHMSLAHGTLDTVIEWSTQGQPAYAPFYQGKRAFSAVTMAEEHTWIGFNGMGPNVEDLNYEGPFYNFQVVRNETIPALTNASGSSAVPPPGANAEYNMDLEWSASWDDWDSAPVDTAGQWRMSLRTTDSSSQTVDVTPRRLQHFVVTPGAGYNWENRRVSDNGLAASGTVVADVDGLITVENFAVSSSGNRLILEPTGGTVPASLTLAAPNGGENWPTGSQRQIEWTTTGSVSQVNLYYSTDNFSTRHDIALTTANTGSYAWTTPVTPSTSVRVRVESVVSPTTVYDISDAVFTLYDASGPNTYVFTATIAPANATQPVTYNWSPAPTGGQGTPYATYQWDTPGARTITVTATNCGGTFSDAHTITIGGGPTSDLDVTLTVSNPLSTARTDEPVTSGVPVPHSVNLTDLSTLRLLDSSDQPVPAQFTPLARWGGGPDNASKPVRWLLLDFQADVPANDTAMYRLVDSGGTTSTYPTLAVTDGPAAVTVNTGAAQFSISKTDGRLTGPDMDGPMFGQAISDGTVYTTTGPVTVTVELAGDMRASVHVMGAYRDNGSTPLLDHTSRYWFYAGQPVVRLFHTIENNTPCPLDGGQLDCYDIGSGGSVTVTDMSLVLSTDLDGSLTYQAGGEGTIASGDLTDDLLLYQDSSGTDHWDTFLTWTSWTTNTLDTRPRMQAYVSFRGYSTTLGSVLVDSGDHAAGWLNVAGTGSAWTVGVRDFWRNFPKALRATASGAIEIGLFPDEFGPAEYDFNLRAGEHKTHEVFLSPSSTSLHPHTLFAKAPAQWYVNSGAFGLTALPNFADWPDHENYINYQLDTSPAYEEGMDWYPNLLTAIETTDFYGIFDYGDWPIDYEGYGIAPLNIKYDSDYGMWVQWLRGGDSRWFRLAEALNRHSADIDILHNLHTPRHWGDGIAFGHSYHDEWGFVNPHRNYGGNHPDTAYGEKGMLLTYYLTGYEKAYESALELADCIEYRLHNDSHLCGYFPGDCSGDGYGLTDSDGLYQDGSRPAANGLSIAVAAYRATADPRYLAVADAMVDWAQASEQPYIGGPTGTSEMIKPQMLNLYLRALADYLEMRDEFGLPDTYDGQGSFLDYANWLHTYPWVDLTPIAADARASYPYEWWFDGRAENDDGVVCNWLLLGADTLSYAYQLDDTGDYLDWATALFFTGSRDPWFEGDANTYAQSKETANSVSFGHIFLNTWEGQ